MVTARDEGLASPPYRLVGRFNSGREKMGHGFGRGIGTAIVVSAAVVFLCGFAAGALLVWAFR